LRRRGDHQTYERITKPMKVQIADDPHPVRQIILKTISGSIFNCEMAETRDGTMAIDQCKAARFDAVFLDCNMLALSGLETLQQLLAIEPDMEIVMIFGERDASYELRAWRSKAAPFALSTTAPVACSIISGLRTPPPSQRHRPARVIGRDRVCPARGHCRKGSARSVQFGTARLLAAA
jgi:CheY-like chemotaxis protein